MNEKNDNKNVTAKNIKFYKKIWYSIAKTDKYEEMTNEGLLSAAKYFLTLIAILSVILSSLGTAISGIKNVNDFLTNMCAYIISYIIILFLILGFYVIVISISCKIVDIILKLKGTYKLWLLNTIYAITLSAIILVVYTFFQYFTKIMIPYFETINMLIIYIYLGIILRKRKEKK